MARRPDDEDARPAEPPAPVTIDQIMAEAAKEEGAAEAAKMV